MELTLLDIAFIGRQLCFWVLLMGAFTAFGALCGVLHALIRAERKERDRG